LSPDSHDRGEAVQQSPVESQKYLTGIIFPASKALVVATLQRQGAPAHLVGQIEADVKNQGRFVSPAAVSQVWWNEL